MTATWILNKIQDAHGHAHTHSFTHICRAQNSAGSDKQSRASSTGVRRGPRGTPQEAAATAEQLVVRLSTVCWQLIGLLLAGQLHSQTALSRMAIRYPALNSPRSTAKQMLSDPTPTNIQVQSTQHAVSLRPTRARNPSKTAPLAPLAPPLIATCTGAPRSARHARKQCSQACQPKTLNDLAAHAICLPAAAQTRWALR